MNRRAYDLRDQYPDPGSDPVKRLRHVLAVHADTNPEDMAVQALSGVYDHPTGLTYGDLRALLDRLDEK